MHLELNHKHMIMTAFIKNPPMEAAYIENWLNVLVEKIKMKILIGPHAIRCVTEGNEGVTGFVCIETSHASIHIFETETPFLKFDLYSCMDFEPQTIIDHMESFDIERYEYKVIDRNDEACVTHNYSSL